jgi:UDP-N-acetylmuramoylalanine--D-glutamate ligase
LRSKYGNSANFWAKATTVQHIFFENVKTKNIIGVTGTKGKGTTSTLIAKMLAAAGKKVHLGGNIGNSMLDFVHEVQPDNWVVLELSNFQLKDFPYSPHIAVCLMIAPEHMDWHADMNDYLEAKANIFKHQKPEDIAIYFAKDDNSQKIASYSPGKKIPYFQKPGAHLGANRMIAIGEDEMRVTPITEVKLLGEHNLQNICAAITAVWEVTQDLDAVRQVLHSFSGLEHRLELVRASEGIKYYDDSFGTTPDTAIVALRSFKEPKVVILGGSDKGIPFDHLADEVVKSNVRQVIAIGKTGPKIAELIRRRGFTNITEGLSRMPEIVAAASQAAQPGDVVLLSTGCASFGLFRDYKDRGDQFKAAVQALA